MPSAVAFDALLDSWQDTRVTLATLRGLAQERLTEHPGDTFAAFVVVALADDTA